MNLLLNNISIPIERDGKTAYQQAASAILQIEPTEVKITRILSKALDLRDQAQFHYILTLAVEVDENYPNVQGFKQYHEQKLPPTQHYSTATRPLVVGFGPAGMFAALELIDHGLKPIIFDRGKNIKDRTHDVQTFIKKRLLNPESNIQFGEGGAGSYSDGKLFSRRNRNTGTIHHVLQTFIKFGAPPEIDYIHKPHLGTDVLCKIVSNIRNYILQRGGEIHYNAKMTDLLLHKDCCAGICINGTQEHLSSAIFLAIGHSARDTYTMLHQRGVAMESKPISIGVRIEHPRQVIDLMRYGPKYHNHSLLGAATYSLNYTNRQIKRGVYTFCMCPGGEVLNASSQNGLLVINGMSYSHRSSPFSNGALAVTCHPTDYPTDSPLAGLAFQEGLEQASFKAGGADWKVPAQQLQDFLKKSLSRDLPKHSYKMGATIADLRELLPDFVIDQLQNAFLKWSEEVPLFVSDQAILMAPETRTSSPVRLLRHDFQSVNTKNLYPIGEGSGYTGGISSSAADGVKAVESYLARL